LAEYSGLVEQVGDLGQQVGELKAKAEELESRVAMQEQEPLKKKKTITEESDSDKQVAAYQSFVLFQLTLTLTHQ